MRALAERRRDTAFRPSAGMLRRIGEHVASIKAESYSALALGPGERVLDVGCGPGVDVLELARRVEPGGRAIGVDVDTGMIRSARTAAARAGLESLAEFRHGDAASLPYAEAYFDACRCDRVLQYVTSPAACVREMARVLRPGGRLALVDSDHYSVCVDTPHVAIERRLVQFRAERFRNGAVGRRLRGLLVETGLEGSAMKAFAVHCETLRLAEELGLLPAALEEEAVEAGAVTREEAERWRASLVENDERGVFGLTCHIVLASATKPR